MINRTKLTSLLLGFALTLLCAMTSARAEDSTPTPEEYVSQVGGDTHVLQPGEFKLDGRSQLCGQRPTVVDNLRAVFARAGLSDQEIRTLRGVISSIDRAHLRQGRPPDKFRKPEADE